MEAQDTQISEDRIGVVNTDALFVRQMPAEDAEVTSLLAEAQEVYILGEQDGFYKIAIVSEGEKELVGYVKKEYIDIE